MIGIEIFSGAGGMSLGASMAGIEVKLAVEINQHAAKTFVANHPDANVIVDDIRNVKELKVDAPKGVPKILFGGPPCQGFSRSNHRTRNKENPNNWLFEEFVRIAKIWRPDWIVLENVQGILGTEKGLFFNEILLSFKRLGYSITFDVLNAMYHGVPQNRERLFVVGSLHNEKFQFPTPQKKVITVKEAINDLPVLPNGNKDSDLPYRIKRASIYATNLRGNSELSINNGISKNTDEVLRRYEFIPQGGNWSNIPEELMGSYADASRCHTGIYHRLDENKPSVVIGNYRKNMLIHPTQDRGLSVREAARLQSFPDNFKFLGTLGDQQQQVGNAVPPLLAKSVFKQLCNGSI